MAKALRAGVAPAEIRVPRVRPRCAHELIRASGILPVAKQGRFGRVPDRVGFCRYRRSLCAGGVRTFALAMPDVARIIIVTRVRIVDPVSAAEVRGTLLNLGIRLPLP